MDRKELQEKLRQQVGKYIYECGGFAKGPALDTLTKKLSVYVLNLSDHKPAVLPEFIGKEWELLLEKYDHSFDAAVEVVINDRAGADMYDWTWNLQEDGKSPSLILAYAYKYGWQPEKAKRYLLPMANTKMGAGLVRYAFYNQRGFWDTIRMKADKTSLSHIELSDLEVTETQLRSAPAWVKTIEKVEVNL